MAQGYWVLILDYKVNTNKLYSISTLFIFSYKKNVI